MLQSMSRLTGVQVDVERGRVETVGQAAQPVGEDLEERVVHGDRGVQAREPIPRFEPLKRHLEPAADPREVRPHVAEACGERLARVDEVALGGHQELHTLREPLLGPEAEQHRVESITLGGLRVPARAPCEEAGPLVGGEGVSLRVRDLQEEHVAVVEEGHERQVVVPVEPQGVQRHAGDSVVVPVEG